MRGHPTQHRSSRNLGGNICREGNSPAARQQSRRGVGPDWCASISDPVADFQIGDLVSGRVDYPCAFDTNNGGQGIQSSAVIGIDEIDAYRLVTDTDFIEPGVSGLCGTTSKPSVPSMRVSLIA